jgi:hypothetical protein
MKPLAALKPPPLNTQTKRLFRAVYGALNDIDRAMYPPVQTLRERHGKLVAAYQAIGDRFALEAAAIGLSDWLRFEIVNRTFVLGYDEAHLDEARRLYEEMERLGYPAISPLVCLRMIWANRLAEANELEKPGPLRGAWWLTWRHTVSYILAALPGSFMIL